MIVEMAQYPLHLHHLLGSPEHEDTAQQAEDRIEVQDEEPKVLYKLPKNDK